MLLMRRNESDPGILIDPVEFAESATEASESGEPISIAHVCRRKRLAGSEPTQREIVRPRDMFGWKHNGSSEPVKVYRSPLEPDTWLTQTEFDFICLATKSLPHRSRKSMVLILHPADGEIGYFIRPNRSLRSPRDRKRYDAASGRWIYDPEARHLSDDF